MTSWAALKRRERSHHLRALARAVLEEYGLQESAITPLKISWNAIYRVDAPDRRRYVLRLGIPDVRSLVDVQSELAWLRAIKHDTDISVPDPVPTPDGRWIVSLDSPEAGGERHSVLFHWIGGRTYRRSPSPRASHLLGAAMARLHVHADTFEPPTPFTDLTMDSVYSFGPSDPLADHASHPSLTPETRALFAETAARVQTALDHLYADRSAIRFLHFDMHFGNMRYEGNRIHILDFDDSLWAHSLQDMGVTLAHFLHRQRSEDLRIAFLDGYRSVRPLPHGYDEWIEACIDHRILDMLSLGLSLTATTDRWGDAEAMIARAEAHLKRKGPMVE